MEKFGDIIVLKNEDKTNDGGKYTLIFNFRKNEFSFQLLGKGGSNNTLGTLQTFNITFKGKFLITEEVILFDLQKRRDYWHETDYINYPMKFYSKYQFIDNDKLTLLLDKNLHDLQWGDEPSEVGFPDDINDTYLSFHSN